MNSFAGIVDAACHMCVFAKVIIALALTLTLFSCGGGEKKRLSASEGATESTEGIESQTPAESSQQDTRPLALVVERSVGGPFYGTALSEPTTIRSGSDGSIYLIDYGNQRLLKLNSALESVAEIGGSGSFRNFLDDPRGLAVGRSYVFVSDTQRDRVHRLDWNLTPVDVLEFEDAADAFKFGEPVGLAVTVDEDLWVVDHLQRRVAVFNRNLEFQEYHADYNSGGYSLRSPGAAVGLTENRVVVCDIQRGELAIFDERGAELGMIGKGILRAPSDISQSPNGLIWVADSLLDEVVCLDRTGSRVFSSSQSGSQFKLMNPSGVCAVSDDTLLISDSGSGELLVCRVYYSE